MFSHHTCMRVGWEINYLKACYFKYTVNISDNYFIWCNLFTLMLSRSFFLATYKQWAYKNCTLLGYYAASNSNSLPTFRDYLSVPPWRVENLFWILFGFLAFADWILFGFLTLEDEPIGCPQTSVRNYHYSLRKNPEERSSHLLRGGSLKSRMSAQLYKNRLFSIRTSCKWPTAKLFSEWSALNNLELLTVKTHYIVTAPINHKTMKMYDAMEVQITAISIQC
jgi:hypothetical protein